MPRRRRSPLPTVLVFLATALPALADDVRRGAFTATFGERHPLNTMAEQERRFAWNDKPAGDYDVAAESFEVVVPADYDPSTPYGLLVWISPSDSGRLRVPGWDEVLARHRIIWVGPNGAGNRHHLYRRGGLALDAAHNVARQYNVDPRRVYVAGMSGGAKSASVYALGYADVFAGGGFFQCGVRYFRHIPADRPNTFYSGAFKPPPLPMVNQAKRTGRYVLLTGETDGNQPSTRAAYEHCYVKDRFAHVTYLEVPGMGHETPDAAWFEKGIAFLDTVPPDASTRPTASTAPSATGGARPNPDEAKQLLEMADNYLAAGRPEAARVRLQKVVDAYPGTPEAKAAAAGLAKLPKP